MPGLRGPRKDEAITKRAKFTLQLQYNSPVILTFFLLSLLVLFLGQWTNGWTTMHLFCVYRSSFKDPLFYVRLFGHVLGHASWDHFFGNIMMLLVVGPLLEEKYGSANILFVILATALVTGVINFIFFPHVQLLGASGVVFAFILLASLTSIEEEKIPLTFILVALIYIGQQVYNGLFIRDNIANLSHIIGGITGAALGFAMNGKRRH